jgi:uncharacterized membrane protein YhhN
MTIAKKHYLYHKMARFILVAFFIDAAVNLWAEYSHQEILILMSKPLLISLLALWYFIKARPFQHQFERWILAGLLFSIGGDSLLMFVESGPKDERFFLLGLGSFLLAQLSYLTGFLKYPGARTGAVFQRPLLALPFLLYLIVLLSSLWPGIPEAMKLPVAIYASAIVGMAIAAYNLRSKTSAAAFIPLIAGVLLFVVSDSLIALNKFGEAIPLARVYIMSTYIIGQYLIASGVIGMKRD